VQVADEGISKDRHFFFNFIGFVLVVGFQLDLNLDGGRDPITLKYGQRQWVHVDENSGVFNGLLFDFSDFTFLGFEGADFEKFQRPDGGAHQ